MRLGFDARFFRVVLFYGLWLGNLLLFDGGVTVKNRILAVKKIKDKYRQNHQKKKNAKLVKNFATAGWLLI